MHDHRIANLALEPGSNVRDAECGFDHVAIHPAKSAGFHVHGIHVMNHLVVKARNNDKTD